MGQKINPNGFRFGVNKNWQSRWIANSDAQMAEWLVQDDKIRKMFYKDYKNSQIDRIEIERTVKTIDLFIYCGQPGVIIGKDGENIKKLTLAINKIVGRQIKVNINAILYENVAWSARVIAREIAEAIENRVSFRNAQKAAIRKVMASKALGIKTNVSGRLGGVEMAREEGYSEGVIPMNTIRSDLDYAIEEAHTTYGIIGCKVWINRGEIFKKGLNNQNKPQKPMFDRNRSNGFNNRRPAKNARPTAAKSTTTKPVAENKKDGE